MFGLSCKVRVLAILVFLIADVCTAESPAPPWQEVPLGPAGASYAFPVYSNRRFNDDMTSIKRVLLIQHGRARDGEAYYLAAEKLMGAFDANPEEILLISPQFLSPEQRAKGGWAKYPAWGTGGFAGGEYSIDPPGSISSFQVYDDLLTMLTDAKRFPALQRIVLAGHSGGAVLVQQFAVLNRIDEKVRAAGIDLRYVVANASAYLYFTGERPAERGFADYDAARCPTYNDHRYGLNKLGKHAIDNSSEELFRRYMARDVVYLLGLEDTDTRHTGLDKSCPAQAQGSNRLERGRGYRRHEQDLAGRLHVTGRHRAFEVTGVGHDQQGMFSSTCGVQILFDVAGTEPARGARCTDTTGPAPGTGSAHGF